MITILLCNIIMFVMLLWWPKGPLPISKVPSRSSSPVSMQLFPQQIKYNTWHRPWRLLDLNYFSVPLWRASGKGADGASPSLASSRMGPHSSKLTAYNIHTMYLRKYEQWQANISCRHLNFPVLVGYLCTIALLCQPCYHTLIYKPKAGPGLIRLRPPKVGQG